MEEKPINFTSKNKLHNAEKPIELVSKMIQNSSVEGDIVLDTFMGSGTTAVACINTKRNYIGFEIDENYYSIAINRIKDTMSEPKLAL